MKKLFAMLLALVMTFGACALAEDDNWTEYDSVVTKLLYSTTEEMMESDASRAVACGAAFIDFVLAETGYELGGGAYFYLLDYDDNFPLFIAPVDGDSTINSVTLLCNLDEQHFSMLPSELSAERAYELLSDGRIGYRVETSDVAETAKLLVEAIAGDD